MLASDEPVTERLTCFAMIVRPLLKFIGGVGLRGLGV